MVVLSTRTLSVVLSPQPAICRSNRITERRTRCHGASGSDIGLKSGQVTVINPFPPSRHSERFQQLDCKRDWKQAAATALLSTALVLFPAAGIWPAAAAANPSDASTGSGGGRTIAVDRSWLEEMMLERLATQVHGLSDEDLLASFQTMVRPQSAPALSAADRLFPPSTRSPPLPALPTSNNNGSSSSSSNSSSSSSSNTDRRQFQSSLPDQRPSHSSSGSFASAASQPETASAPVAPGTQNRTQKDIPAAGVGKIFSDAAASVTSRLPFQTVQDAPLEASSKEEVVQQSLTSRSGPGSGAASEGAEVSKERDTLASQQQPGSTVLTPSASQVQRAAVTPPSVGNKKLKGDNWDEGNRLQSPVDPEAASEVDNTAELFAASGLAMVEGGLEPADYSADGPGGVSRLSAAIATAQGIASQAGAAATAATGVAVAATRTIQKAGAPAVVAVGLAAAAAAAAVGVPRLIQWRYPSPDPSIPQDLESSQDPDKEVFSPAGGSPLPPPPSPPTRPTSATISPTSVPPPPGVTPKDVLGSLTTSTNTLSSQPELGAGVLWVRHDNASQSTQSMQSTRSWSPNGGGEQNDESGSSALAGEGNDVGGGVLWTRNVVETTPAADSKGWQRALGLASMAEGVQESVETPEDAGVDETATESSVSNNDVDGVANGVDRDFTVAWQRSQKPVVGQVAGLEKNVGEVRPSLHGVGAGVSGSRASAVFDNVE